MDETVILPSPNWFQVSGLTVSKDGWIVYSGPSKSLCVLEPLPSNYDAVIQSKSGFKAHVVSRAHPEKIVSIDISPEWPGKRSFLTGSADGSVKQWLAEYDTQNTLQIKTTHVHDVHKHDKEEIAGIGYSNETYAITVGAFGNIVKWDINSNVVKNYNHFLKSFKPTCISCSRHILLNVAVGTKQGVVFVIDLNGMTPGQILYKVRSHDEEITNLSWCPQFEVTVKKSLDSALSARLEKIRNEPEPDENAPELIPFDISKSKSNTSHLKTNDDTNDSKNLSKSEIVKAKSNVSHLKTHNDTNDSKNLNESEIVQEDDMFDIYKDPEDDAFGHKKYEPEDIYVKVKTEKKEEDFLAECLKLKDKILKNKDEPEPTIESLVEALDKTHVASSSEDVEKTEGAKENGNKAKEVSSLHIHRHLLSSIGKYGGLKIYSKSGKLVSSCSVPHSKQARGKAGRGGAAAAGGGLLWLRANELLFSDGKSQLLVVDPLTVDCKNKLQYQIVHSIHKRGLYCIASGAPRAQSSTPHPEPLEGDWTVWSVGQDRQLVEYSLAEKQIIREYNTCGGFVYNIAPCPYDASKIAISVGDGAVRVWEADAPPGERRLRAGRVASYWQNVQGKVLTAAWHPTRENLLAFGTAEARVGLLECTGGKERPAKLLAPATGGVYSLRWAAGGALLAAAGGELLRYQTERPDEAPTTIPVEVEGARWKISSVCWSERALLAGAQAGGVAALDDDGNVLAAVYPFNKIIHGIECHPAQVSESAEASPHRGLLAVSSADKNFQVAILELHIKEDGSAKLSVLKMLSGHKGVVHTVAWNPHEEAELMTTSQDGTVRIWDVVSGTCTSIFGGHCSGGGGAGGGGALGAAWSARPGLPAVTSGGSDCCLRLWRPAAHAAPDYIEPKPQTVLKKDKKKKEKTITKPKEEEDSDSDDQLAAQLDRKPRASKKLLLPITYRKISSQSIVACKKLLKKYLEKNAVVNGSGDGASEMEIEEDPNSDFIRLFGSINEVNELLDEEHAHHEQYKNKEAAALLSLLRGRVAAALQAAAERDALDTFLLSMAPCVSFKYWKEAIQMYLAQIDRLVAKGEHKKLEEGACYGGPLYRKALAQLAAHDVAAAARALAAAHLHKEAYALCRVRHMDSIGEEVLRGWARHSLAAGALPLAAACYIVLGDLQQASFALGKSNVEDHLSLAAELAKLSGQTTFAGHIEEKTELIRSKQTTEEVLEALPTRMELLMREKECMNEKDDKASELSA